MKQLFKQALADDPLSQFKSDLLAMGDARCIETAKLIYDGYLARLFAEA